MSAVQWTILAGALAVPASTLNAEVLPGLAGKWRLDRGRSDDPRARVEAVAGPAQVKSGGASGFTILPELNTRTEVERVELREWMLGIAGQLDRLEIQQSGDTLRVYTGEDLTRTFYLKRDHVREDSQGRKLKCRARVEADRLVLEESGEQGLKMVEIFTPVPANGWLVHAIRYEHDRLKKPLELRLVYVKDAE
jgi:hypothetical protein